MKIIPTFFVSCKFPYYFILTGPLTFLFFFYIFIIILLSIKFSSSSIKTTPFFLFNPFQQIHYVSHSRLDSHVSTQAFYSVKYFFFSQSFSLLTSFTRLPTLESSNADQPSSLLTHSPWSSFQLRLPWSLQCWLPFCSFFLPKHYNLQEVIKPFCEIFNLIHSCAVAQTY